MIAQFNAYFFHRKEITADVRRYRKKRKLNLSIKNLSKLLTKKQKKEREREREKNHKFSLLLFGFFFLMYQMENMC